MLIRGALRIGISAADLELFSIGSLLDVLLYEPADAPDAIEATQAHFDAF